MYSNMKYYEDICNCLRVIQQDINRKLKSANCWQRTSLNSQVHTFKNIHSTFYVFNSYDVIFHATSDTNDVITVDVTQLHHFKTVIKLKF